MKAWLLLITSIPGATKTARMRVWRALRASGAATLRDGVYLLPDSSTARDAFALRAAEIEAAGGDATLLPLTEVAKDQLDTFLNLFDRSGDYDRICAELTRLRRELGRIAEPEARRRLASLRREVAMLDAVDFFPSERRAAAQSTLSEAEAALGAAYSPDEPRLQRGVVARRDSADYRGRIWATRRHLWIDRVCSAWLIRRFIDPQARFVWLTDPTRCPRDAVGFDFDGATFTHADGRITFEVLTASFGLDDDAGLAKLGAVVHYLDVGGDAVVEAAGLERIMVGARSMSTGDEDVLAVMGSVLDCLYAGYSGERHAPSTSKAPRRAARRHRVARKGKVGPRVKRR